MYKLHYVKDMADHFTKKDSCFIMAEMYQKEDCEIVLAGDFNAMVHCLGGMIHRFAQLNHKSFNDAVVEISSYYYLSRSMTENPDSEPEDIWKDSEDDDDGKYKEI
jgi:hypothetical protein